MDIKDHLKLRDMRFLAALAEAGSMAKAAAELGVTQSAVSQVIAGMEAVLGVQLFDRSQRGVTPTIYGEALIRRGRAALDEVRTGLQEVAVLKSEGTGLIRIGCPETLAASVLPLAIETFAKTYPAVTVEVETFTGAEAAGKLLDRSIDLVLARDGPGLEALSGSADFSVLRLFEDKLGIVVGASSRWAKIRKLKLEDLDGAPWIVLPYGWGEGVLPAAFAAKGLPAPHIALKTFSIHLRLHLLATGQYVTALPRSVFRLHADRFGLKELAIDLPPIPYGVALVTLKDRTQTRTVEQFIKSTASLFNAAEIYILKSTT